MTDLRYWIGLNLVPEIGPITVRKLLDVMGSPENVFKSGNSDLSSACGLGKEAARNIREFSQWDLVEQKMRVIEKKEIKVVVYTDSTYPEVLRQLPDAPSLLYMKGDYLPDDRFSIAMVGSRKYTPYGESVASSLSAGLSEAGFTIISGLARGIDTMSHVSALKAGGRTIAVLGSGLDILYPPENRSLVDKIAEAGCVITEFLPGTPPNRENFPRRNRLISGLSLGVVVVEAALDSGSLITAQYALEQNREVFAVPGSIYSENSAGTHRLIRQGARLVTGPQDIISELAPPLKTYIRSRTEHSAAVSDEERSLCSFLSREPKHIDLLSRESRTPVQKALAMLLSLELKGLVRQSGGKCFYRA